MGSDFYNHSILPYAGIIIKICRAYTNTPEDFEDYYQEVCLQIWRSKDRFTSQSKWSTWIYKLSLNVCLTYLKKSKNTSQIFVSDYLPKEAIKDSQTAGGHPLHSTQEDRAVSDDDILQLYAAIRQLSETDRAIILLYLEEKSYLEISEIIGTNSNNIGVRIKRIKQRLNKILNIEG